MKIGIDLGGSHIAVGVVTEDGKILVKKQEDLNISNKENIKELIRDKIISLINSVLKELQMPTFVIEKIGIGVPGIVKENVIEKCEKYEIYNWDLAKELIEVYGISVNIQNDALCAAKAEVLYGNLKDLSKGVFMCLGTGIGGSIIIENKVYPSEFGHMIIEENGRMCHCKRKGCFETYSSMKVFKEGIIELLNLNKDTKSEEILNILNYEKENRELNKYIDEYLEKFLIGISNIINIINPDVICVGGSFTYFEDVLYKKLLEKVDNLTCQFNKPKIVLAKLQNDAGIIGATIF